MTAKSLLLTCLLPAVLHAQTAVKEVHSDTFESDPRERLKVSGDVSWQPGRLDLAEGSAVGGDAELDAVAQLSLTPVFPDQSSTQTRIVFLVKDKGESTVVILREPGTLKLFVVDRYEDEGTPTETVSRRVVLREDPGSGPIVFGYNNGLVTVHQEERLLAAGAILNGTAPVDGWRIDQMRGELTLTSVALKGAPRRVFTKAQLTELARAEELNQQLISLFQSGKPREAIQAGEEALRIREQVLGVNHFDVAASVNNLAKLHEALGRYLESRPLFAKAVRIVEKAAGKEHPESATMLNNLAMLDYRLGSYKLAEGPLLESLKVRRKLLGTEDPNYAASLNNLGALYSAMGRFRESHKLYLEALEIRERALGKSHPEYAQALNNLAHSCTDLADFGEAERLLREACDTMRRVAGPDHPNYAVCLVNLANHYQFMGQLDRAEELLREAHSVYVSRLGEGHPRVAIGLQTQSDIWLSRGDFVRAEELLRQSHAIFEERLGGRHPTQISCLVDLAVLFHVSGELARAESLLREARELHLKILGPGHPTYPARLGRLADLWYSMRKLGPAEEYLEEARTRSERVHGRDHPSHAAILLKLGLVYLNTDRVAEAIATLEEARVVLERHLGTEHEITAEALSRLATAHEVAGNTDEASKLHAEVVRIARITQGTEHVLYAAALRTRASHLLKRGDTSDALDLAKQSVAAWRSAVSRCLPSMSEAQALAFLEKHQPATDIALVCAARDPAVKAEEVYRVVWDTRAAATRFVSQNRLRDDAPDELRVLHEDLQRARTEVATLALATSWADPREQQKQLQAASQRKEDLERAFAKASGHARRPAFQESTPDDLARVLPADTALLEIVRETRHRGNASAEVRYHAFVVTASGKDLNVEYISLGDADEIDQVVTDWRHQVRGDRLVRRGSDPAKRLRALVWEPVQLRLGSRRTVIIVPDGRLTGLSWSALPGAKPGTFLLHDYAICTAPFGQQVLAWLQEAPVAGEGLLLAGNIDYGKRGNTTTAKTRKPRTRTGASYWEPLAGAARETTEVADLFRTTTQGAVRNLGGADVSEARLAGVLPDSRFVHFATHGFFAGAGQQQVFGADPRRDKLYNTDVTSELRSASFAGRNPLVLSGLVLSGANQRSGTVDRAGDGILLAEEVVSLDLRNTELVVLSACETGLGEVAAGEGVFGLQRAFALAGARSSVASLWKVDDNATRALMTMFYRNLWEKKLGRLESLRQAQLALLRSYEPRTGKLRGLDVKARKLPGSDEQLPPYYWAAFQFAGDWR